MSWWSSVVDGFTSVGTKISNGVKWAWSNASLSSITVGAVTYTANTAFQVLEQGLALRKAVPTLINNASARKIVNGMGYILVNGVIPIVALNYANNSVQTYFREGHEADEWYAPYSIFLGTLSLVGYGVQAYTMRQGAQTLVQITVLNSVGPAAFNSNKLVLPPSLCKEQKCNFKRQMKGDGRAPIILAANDGAAALISLIPYGGEATASVLRIFFNGRYITRSVTPERCERHKAMMSESVLALGLTYEASSMLMDYVLESTVGMPPFLYYRTMKYLLLLLHMNVAAHMSIPLVEDKDATLPFDPLNAYERVCRFIADVIFAGVMKRVPIDFKPDKDAPPLIPLSPALRYGSRLLNSDLETVKKVFPGLVKQSLITAREWIVPPIFQANGLVNDPVIAMYWPDIQKGSLYAVETLLSYRESKTKTTLDWIPPKGVALAINLKFGVPKKLTQFLIMLSKEEDFWDFLSSLKHWLQRNKVKTIVELSSTPHLTLLGAKSLVTLLPEERDNTPSLPANRLVSARVQPLALLGSEKQTALIPSSSEESPTLSAEQLMSARAHQLGFFGNKRPEPVLNYSDKTPHPDEAPLSATKHEVASASVLRPVQKETNTIHASNLFTTRRRVVTLPDTEPSSGIQATLNASQ
ncbi:hypothetical protein [uncultured Legionella sp.]|uniref:hypothetical protein n=1 Tax=uncultured Legionella sp. TaxID=210934 RepID=UPI00260772CF|nr:hypothetical protein [uncultured Legionella sp.]